MSRSHIIHIISEYILRGVTLGIYPQLILDILGASILPALGFLSPPFSAIEFSSVFSKKFMVQMSSLETNIATENRPSQKESSLPTINFKGLCLCTESKSSFFLCDLFVPKEPRLSAPGSQLLAILPLKCLAVTS